MTDNISIHHFDSIGGTPCFLPALQNYVKTIENSNGLHFLGYSNRDPCVAAMIGSVCIGAMIYSVDQPMRRAHINYSFVQPDYRGRGIYQMMFNQLENRVRGLNLGSISSLVGVNNQSQLKASAKVGMIPIFYRMNKDLV